MSFFLYPGDCVEILRQWPEACIDAVVTDPPAGISFMGKKWDSDKGGRDEWIAWFADVSKEMLRVLKPGAHGFVWALPRTSHWTATGLEDGGFEIRDINHHLFGTGYPKSKNLNDELGTALKPAVEHWILVRRGLEGTVEENHRKWGTGCLNIGVCRTGRDDINPSREGELGDRGEGNTSIAAPLGPRGGSPRGRWPANITLTEEGAAEVDAQSGERKSGAWNGKRNGDKFRGVYSTFKGTEEEEREGSVGGASRFWYCAKPSRAERDLGCEFLPLKSAGEATGGREEGSAGLANARAGAGRTSGARNHHPTAKSIALMRWLTRLVTPPGGTVLDPFCGSGTTGIAALQEGFRFVGIEKELEYLAIANARIHAHREGKT